MAYLAFMKWNFYSLCILFKQTSVIVWNLKIGENLWLSGKSVRLREMVSHNSHTEIMKNVLDFLHCQIVNDQLEITVNLRFYCLAYIVITVDKLRQNYR